MAVVEEGPLPIVDIVSQIAYNSARRRLPQNGEMYTSRTFLIFLGDISKVALQKKIAEPFQALNCLKCSTVGNIGS